MMKKAISLILALIMCLSLCACGGKTNAPETTETPTETTEAIIKQFPGDTVSTDIIELTVKKAALAYYAEAASTSVSNGKTANVDSACEPKESGGFYECNKGHALVCLNFVLKNIDRGSLNTSSSIVGFSVCQGENTGNVFGYDLNDPNGSGGLNLSRMPVAMNGGEFKTCDTNNIILSAGEYAEIKWVGVVNFEPDSLSEPFELYVDLKNSSGEKEQFVFSIE